MKKTSILLICFIALTAFCVWTPDSSAESIYYTSTPGQNLSCATCHNPAPPTCAGCHFHGGNNITATTDQPSYAPGEPITVSISGGNQIGWVRTILYDPDGNEIARSAGTSGMGDGPQFPGPIELTASAPNVPGIYTWAASWYGHSFRNGATSGNFVPDLLNANHGEVTVSTNSFEVVAQCDANAPVVTAPANMTITLAAGSTGPVPVSDPGIQNFLNGAGASDAEDGDNLSVTNNAPTDFPVGMTPVTFFATDSCNNQGSATANVTVQVADNSLPVVTAPASVEVTAPLCEASVPATHPDIADFLSGATAADTEDGNVAASITTDAPADFPMGTVTTVTFTASDSLGAIGTATATVTVNETPNTGPAVTAPTAITIMVPAGTTSVPATDSAIVAFLDGATSTDDEDGDLPVANNAPADFPLGTTAVTFSAEDSCGVSASADSTITIQEENGNIAPILNLPDQISVDAQMCETSVPAGHPDIAAFLNGATATDTEDGDFPSSEITNNAPGEFPIGTTPVTFSVTDGDGATTTGVASIMVVDTNTAPVVIAPAPLSITVDAGTTSVPATDTAIAAFLNGATATDAEDGDFPSGAITNDAPAAFPLGVTTVTFSVKDSCGLSGTAGSTVTSTVTITETITEVPPPVVDPPSGGDDDDDIDEDENEDDDDIDEDENENKYPSFKKYLKKKIRNWKETHYWKKKYENENKYHYEDKPFSRKLRLLRGEDD